MVELNFKILGFLAAASLVAVAVLFGSIPVESFDFRSVEEKPNVVLVTIESMPAERLECYGYERETMPNLCEFAENATIYEDAYSEGYTALSTPAIETGKHPYRLGITDQFSAIPTGERTLAEALQSDGFHTVYGQGYGKVPVYNQGQGYQSVLRPIHFDRHHVTRVLEQNEDPVFVRRHLWGTHGAGNPDRVKGIIGLGSVERDREYDLNFVDELKSKQEVIEGEHYEYESDIKDEQSRVVDRYRVKRIIDEIKASGEFDDTMIIFTSDHGTLMRKDNDGIGGHMHPSTSETHLNIPLIIKYPGQKKGKRVDGTVSLVDLYPTILEEAGANPDKEMDGEAIDSGERSDPLIATTNGKGISVLNDTHKLYRCSNRRLVEGCESGIDYLVFEREGEDWELISKEGDDLPLFKERMVSYLRSIGDMDLRQDQKVELEDRLRELGYID